jgi:hypothetical protein
MRYLALIGAALIGSCVTDNQGSESLLARAVSQLDVEGLGKKVFIGQAYPSGNVYLECFRDKADCQSLWPKELVIMPLGDTNSVLKKTRMKASFVKGMKDERNNNRSSSIYIPGVEGMADDHKPCGRGEIKKVKQYKYISQPVEDYFYAIIDHCEDNEGVGIYHTSSSKYSFLVLGIDPGIAVTDLKLLSGKRPLAPVDQQEIAKQKRELQEEAVECETAPAYIDSATQIAEISLAEGDLRLKVSTYETPGCGGHLSGIYILDVLRSNMVLRKFEVDRFQGAL